MCICAKAKEGEKVQMVHTSTLREVKSTYSKKNDLSLEVNTAIQEAF